MITFFSLNKQEKNRITIKLYGNAKEDKDLLVPTARVILA